MRIRSKRKIKNIGLTIAIVVAGLLLVNVLIVALQFRKVGKDIDISTKEKEKVTETFTLTNESSYSESEITKIITEKRNALIKLFDEAKYYNISEIDKNYSEADTLNYIAIDDEFLNNLHKLITDKNFDFLTENIELIKTEHNKTFYKMLKNNFDYLYYRSAIATLDVTNTMIYPTYANNNEINAIVNIANCPNNTNNCEQNDNYKFTLLKIDENWLVDDMTSKRVSKLP